MTTTLTTELTGEPITYTLKEQQAQLQADLQRAIVSLRRAYFNLHCAEDEKNEAEKLLARCAKQSPKLKPGLWEDRKDELAEKVRLVKVALTRTEDKEDLIKLLFSELCQLTGK